MRLIYKKKPRSKKYLNVGWALQKIDDSFGNSLNAIKQESFYIPNRILLGLLHEIKLPWFLTMWILFCAFEAVENLLISVV